MSAESHQKRAPTSSETGRLMMPNTVPPQPVSDRSIIDSVAGFINDVALTNTPQTNPKDHILWVKFESLADISDTCLSEDWDVEGNLPPPLLLCIGYGSGVQVWAVPANGEAVEVMSWKHGSVNVLRILPTPFLSNNSELANDLLDQFIHKRPLMALCGDCPLPNVVSTQSQQLHAVNFVSLKDGDLVKTIRFKSPILDVIANRTSIAITFFERIAIFDARTLEDRLTVTTCYPCPNGLCPIALGDRWLAYAERKLIPSKVSAGGCFIDGVPSYTATVLNAAKSLGKGLRELGEQVAAGLTGTAASGLGSTSSVNSSSGASADGSQPGVVTILDIKHPIKDISPTSGTPVASNGNDPFVAHFLAHTEAIFAMSFDPSGMLLLTADRRGHDFNVFRIQPHPCGAVLAAVHHLYVLHRGDTTAKVQDISFTFDSRWVAVSTLRGTTHVFPMTPYGGHCGYRTHSAPHVVNRLSRFHRSAGLPVDGRSSSPILMADHAIHSTAYANPRLPPFPHPTVILPLAQLRQPWNLGSATSLLPQTASTHQGSKINLQTKQRHHSTEESHSKPLRLAAVFAKARSWLLDPPGMHETPSRLHRRAVDSLFVIAGHGALIQYDLEPRHASNVSKEKICDETPIELEVEAKAQWILGQRSNSQAEISPPLSADNWLIKDRVIDNNLNLDSSQMDMTRSDDRWLSQVEIITHAGPSRRLWMGPQFVFKLYNTPSGHSLAHIDSESIEVGARNRSTPVNMPHVTGTLAATRPMVPVLIESGSCSSHEQSPRLLDSFQYEGADTDIIVGPDSQLKEDLADAMKDCPIVAVNHESGCLEMLPNVMRTLSLDELSNEGASKLHTVLVSIVNPEGTITTVANNSPELVETFSNDNYILENCDETMFRPVITIKNDSLQRFEDEEECSKPVDMPLELVVPVIDERVLEEKKRRRELEQQEKILLQQKAVEVKSEVVVQSKKSKKSQKYNKSSNVEESKQKTTSAKKEVQKGPLNVAENVSYKNVEKIETKSAEEIVKPEEINIESKDDNCEEKLCLAASVDEKSIKTLSTSAENLNTKIDLPELKPVNVEPLKGPSPEKAPEIAVETSSQKPDTFLPIKKGKKGKKQSKASPENLTPKSDELSLEDFPALDLPPLDDFCDADKDAIMKISKHETIDDDDIQIIPHEDTLEIHDSPKISNEDIQMLPTEETISDKGFIKAEDFYEIDDELPPLEPFDGNLEPYFDLNLMEKSKSAEECSQKQEMKKKMSELLKDTNMIFAMCSSLKEIKDDGDAKSVESSQIQRSTSSSMTTNTTTATFASANSNQIGEGHDSDYKSLDFEVEEIAAEEPEPAAEMKASITLKPKVEEPEDISSFEATSSETDQDDSSKRSNLGAKFKREDDEELRPLLDTSVTSLTSPVLAGSITTEANSTTTLPETNQKLQTTSNNGNGKRKNKKKRR